MPSSEARPTTFSPSWRPGSANPASIPRSTCRQPAPHAYVTVVDAILWVLAGDLPVRGVDRDAVGLRRVLVTVQDVMATKRRLSGRAMTLNDAAKAIGVKWEAIRQLVGAGYLVAEQRTDGWVIERADVEAFMAAYVKAADVAARLGTLSKWLPQRLGVEPAIGRDACRSVFYRVEDVETALASEGKVAA